MSKIPRIDSISELARFWDTHEWTDFEDEFEVVKERVFERADRKIVRVILQPNEAEALHRIAQSKGVDDSTLVREWVAEKLQAAS